MRSYSLQTFTHVTETKSERETAMKAGKLRHVEMKDNTKKMRKRDNVAEYEYTARHRM